MQQIGAFPGLASGRPPMAPPAERDVADFPRRRRGAELRRYRNRRIAIRAAVITVAALTGGALFWVLTQGGSGTRASAPVIDLDRLASWSGFGIDQVMLRGHRFTPDSDVFDALQLNRARSVVSFDIIAARTAVEKLAWVEHAAITRVYPDQLLVEITERTPFALWQKGDDLYIADKEGRVLSAADPQTAPHGLFRIAGDGAATEAGGLVALLSGYPDVWRALQLSERVAGRRWRLHLQGGSRIELPATGAAAALADLKGWAGFASILAGGHSIIDLRASGKIAVRQAVEGESAGAEARSIRELIMRAG